MLIMFALLLQKELLTLFVHFCSLLLHPLPHSHFRQLQGSSPLSFGQKSNNDSLPPCTYLLVKSRRALSLTGCLITKTLYYSYMRRPQGRNLPMPNNQPKHCRIAFLPNLTYFSLFFHFILAHKYHREFKKARKPLLVIMIMMIHTVFVLKHHPLTFLCMWNWQAKSLSFIHIV